MSQRTLAAPALDLSDSRWLVETLVGRKLRQAEQAIDVLRLDQALEHAKDDLEAEIRAEMVRATADWLAGRRIRPELEVTAEMLDVLERLREVGREEGELELERLGYRGIRRRALIEGGPGDRDVEGYIGRNLPQIGRRIEGELVVADFGDLTTVAIAQALLRVPGARDLASRVISTALYDGLGETFEANAGLVKAWEYTAVMDSGTCVVCRSFDGKRYASLEELFLDLPNFGPNPRCRGEGRCRCRAVPVDALQEGQVDPVNREDLIARPLTTPDLTEPELQAFADYIGRGTMGQGYTAINRYLRGQFKPRGEELEKIKSRIDLMDGAIARAQPLSGEIVLYRAFANPPAVEAGSVLEDAAFVSTSAGRELPESWAGTYGDVYELHLPAGARGLDLAGSGVNAVETESEILLPRGTRIVVEEVRERVTVYANGNRVVAHDVIARVELPA